MFLRASPGRHCTARKHKEGSYWSYAGSLGGILLPQEKAEDRVITLWILKYSDPPTQEFHFWESALRK